MCRPWPFLSFFQTWCREMVCVGVTQAVCIPSPTVYHSASICPGWLGVRHVFADEGAHTLSPAGRGLG